MRISSVYICIELEQWFFNFLTILPILDILKNQYTLNKFKIIHDVSQKRRDQNPAHCKKNTNKDYEINSLQEAQRLIESIIITKRILLRLCKTFYDSATKMFAKKIQ